MDRCLDEMTLIRCYGSHKIGIRDYTHPRLNVFDPDLCDAIVLGDRDLEFLGCSFELGGGVELDVSVSEMLLKDYWME
jgi:hypothetical protein